MPVRITCSMGPAEEVSRVSEGAFLRLKDGSIMFAFCRFTDKDGNDDGDCDLYFITSRDEGESWSAPAPLLKANEFGVKNIMSVSLMRMQNGDMGVFFLIKENNGTSTVMLCRSRDEGKSFCRCHGAMSAACAPKANSQNMLFLLFKQRDHFQYVGSQSVQILFYKRLFHDEIKHFLIQSG